MPNGVLDQTTEWLRPHVLEASDGILTTAGICEGLAGAGISSKVLIFAGVTGLVAGALAMGAHEYSVLAAERDHQMARLEGERHQLETAPDAELDELTELYVSRGLSRGLARQVAIELTAHDALKAHAEAEHGITLASEADPLRGAAAAATAFAAGAVLPQGHGAVARAGESVRDLRNRPAGFGVYGWAGADLRRPSGAPDPANGEHRRCLDDHHLRRW